MSLKEYIEEFDRLDIRSRHVDDEVEKEARYLKGLRISIQDEINYVKMNNIEEEEYYYTLKVEERLAKKQDQR